MAASVEQQILDIIAKHSDVDPGTLNSESTLTDLGIESLEGIELIFDIEDHFDIHLPEKGPELDVNSAGGLIKAVRTALAAKEQVATAS